MRNILLSMRRKNFQHKMLVAVLLLCLLPNLSACSGREATSSSLENMVPTQDSTEIESSEGQESAEEQTAQAPTETSTEEVSESEAPELTMEFLVQLYEDGALLELVEAEGLSGFLLYNNVKLGDNGDESLTGIYTCDLIGPGAGLTDGDASDREYELQLYYWKAETAEKYGRKENEIDMIRLVEKATQDAALLYDTANSSVIDDLEDFLTRSYELEQYLTVDLPDSYALNYTADMGIFSGWLLEGDWEEPAHGEWISPSWYASGGIGRAEGAAHVLQFEGETLKGAEFMMNHSERLSEAEPIEGCDRPAVLVEYAFDLFTASDWEMYLQENPDADEGDFTSRYWYVFMGEPETDIFYVLFLNQDLFTKEDAVRIARSVRFAPDAFLEM